MPSYYKMHLDETLNRGIYGGQVQDLGFLNYVSTTAQTSWNVGDVVDLPDGRQFRHCLSTGAAIMYPSVGCNFTDTGLISYTAFGIAAAVGDREITLPAATHVLKAKDALKGSFIVVFNGSGTDDITYCVSGNDATAADVAFKVQLEQPLATAIVASTSAVELYLNPWSVIAQANTSVLPRCGAPVKAVSAAANYFWLQTKGPKFINPQSGIGNDNGGIMTYWRHDGTLQKGETALAVTTATNDTNLPAAVVVGGSAAGNGPLVSLLGLV